MDPRALAKERFLLLIDQLAQELGSERKAALRARTDPSYPGKLRDEATRYVGAEQLWRTREALGLRAEFFEDASLGPTPDHRHYLEGARVERDEDQGYPEVETYLAEMEGAGTPVAPEHARKLRVWRRAVGPVEREEIIGYHRGMIAADARKTFERPIIVTPIDEARGQRKLPAKKGRR